MGSITESERKKLSGWEHKVKTGTFEAADALARIKKSALYLADFQNFDEYVAETFGFSKRWADKLVRASEIRQRLGTRVPKSCLPSRITQCAALSEIPESKLVDVWATLTEQNPNPTANQIKRHVNAELLPAKPAAKQTTVDSASDSDMRSDDPEIEAPRGPESTAKTKGGAGSAQSADSGNAKTPAPPEDPPGQKVDCPVCGGSGELDDPSGIPSSLNTEEFRELWAAWLAFHKKERRKSLKTTQQVLHLKKCEEMGVMRALAAIRHSLEGGYLSIFEPNSVGGRRQAATYDPATDGMEYTEE